MRNALYFLLALSPLPFASARPVWQWFWLAFIGVWALAFAGRLALRGRGRWAAPLMDLPRAPIAIVLLFLCWGGLQMILPPFGPGPASLSSLPTLSLEPDAGLKVCLLFLAHLLLFIFAFLHIRQRRDGGRALLIAIAAIGTAYALYGFVMFMSGDQYVLWFEKTAYRNTVTATFINRNSYAAYAGLGLVAVNAIVFTKVAEMRSRLALPSDYLREVIARSGWIYLVAQLLLLTVLLLTGSRAGIVAALVAQAAMVYLCFGIGRGLRSLMAPLALVAVGVLVFALSGDTFYDRLQTADDSTAERMHAYAVIFDAIGARPLTGFGLGTFEDAFRLFRGMEVRLFFDRGHSDYLELAMTAGIPATVLLLAAPVMLLMQLVRRAFVAPKYDIRIVAATGVAAMVQLGLHSALDFSLQMPAVSFLFVVMIALALAASQTGKATS
ncbi:MAG: O-antigen ligase domain-containing protein [Alphaproteobacteria bacterium]|nr:MAG: O-antigen ligase domain-containing protein [Alphaproteobacteria bacterium]